MRILIVHDRPHVLTPLYAFLESKGHVLDTAHHAYAALALAVDNEYDVLVLDAALPGMNGPELCRKLRAELGTSVPVLMLSANASLADKVAGFESGADDYLVEPFAPLELEIRLTALVRRAQGSCLPGQRLRFGELVLDPGTQEACRAGVSLMLTRTGYTLLRMLMRSAPRIVSRESLEHALWGEDRPGSDALRTHIHALRRAIDKPFSQALLRTVPRVGYRLALPDQPG